MEKIFKTISDKIKSQKHYSFMIWKDGEQFPILPYPIRMQFFGIYISLSGRIDGEINLEPACIDNTHIQVYTYRHIIRVIKRSDDFRCIGFVFPHEYWEKLMIETHKYNPVTRIIPCLEVTESQRQKLIGLYNIIRSHMEEDPNGYNSDIVNHLMLSFFFEIGAIYRSKIKTEVSSNTMEQKVSDFLELIYKNFKIHRDVAFYADKLNLSQRYFTTMVKKITGKSALRWIERYVVLEAQILLKSSDLSIKEIATELNFEDPSFFCKYFKRVCGSTPEQYRNE